MHTKNGLTPVIKIVNKDIFFKLTEFCVSLYSITQYSIECIINKITNRFHDETLLFRSVAFIKDTLQGCI